MLLGYTIQKFHFDDDGRNSLQFVNIYKLIAFLNTLSSPVNQGLPSYLRTRKLQHMT